MSQKPLAKPTHDAANPEKKSKFSFGLAFSILWGVLLVFFFFLFMYDKSFKTKMFELAEAYGSPSPLNMSLMVVVETALLMLGMSAAIPELVCAFFYKNYLLSFLVAAVARQTSTIISYFLGKYILKDLVDNYLNDYKIFRIMAKMLKEKPIRTLLVLRFSMIPNFLKYYGIPAINAPFRELNIVVLMTTVLQSHFYLVPGYLARSAYEIQTGEYSDRRAEYALYGSGVFYVVMLGLLVVYTKGEIKKIQAEEEASNEVSDKKKD